MPVEIERKYRVRDPAILRGVDGVRIKQGYMYTDAGVVRVRISGNKAFLTLKGAGLLRRAEYEYPIPLPDAAEMLKTFCNGHVLEKTRHVIRHGDHTFEVDVFHGRHEGLVLAEVELQTEDERVNLPAWIGEEVTHDPRYHNSNLVKQDMRPPKRPAPPPQ